MTEDSCIWQVLSKELKMNKTQILKYQRRFKKRLAEAVVAGALEEVDIYDKRDNLVLTPDLKVKHKSSGYEYTIDHVDGEDDDAIVYLRHPEAPRVPAADGDMNLIEKTTINVKDLRPAAMTAADEPAQAMMPDQLTLPDDEKSKEEEPSPEKADPSLVSVPKAEFEKNYEVE